MDTDAGRHTAVAQEIGDLWHGHEVALRQERPLAETSSLFLVLLLSVLLWLGLLAGGLLFLVGPRLGEIGITLRPVHYGVPLAGSILVWLAFVLGVSLKKLPFGQGLFRKMISLAASTVFRFAKLIRVPEDRIKNSYLTVNNVLTRQELTHKPAKAVLMLIPRCLQRAQCSIDLTESVYNCLRCGECSMKAVIESTEGTGLELRMVTGGSLAQRLIRIQKPDAVVAIACERELVAGIRASWSVPTIAVNNGRPEGPCVNTVVDGERLAEAIRLFPARGF